MRLRVLPPKSLKPNLLILIPKRKTFPGEYLPKESYKARINQHRHPIYTPVIVATALIIFGYIHEMQNIDSLKLDIKIVFLYTFLLLLPRQ
jgi:hypothetical protein